MHLKRFLLRIVRASEHATSLTPPPLLNKALVGGGRTESQARHLSSETPLHCRIRVRVFQVHCPSFLCTQYSSPYRRNRKRDGIIIIYPIYPIRRHCARRYFFDKPYEYNSTSVQSPGYIFQTSFFFMSKTLVAPHSPPPMRRRGDASNSSYAQHKLMITLRCGLKYPDPPILPVACCVFFCCTTKGGGGCDHVCLYMAPYLRADGERKLTWQKSC